jgi:hypothetical protein
MGASYRFELCGRLTRGPRGGLMTASFCCETLLRSGSAVIRDFQIAPLRNGEIVSQRERWDEEWREVGRSHGWELPPLAPWPLRLWGIRYVRAAVAAVRLIRQNELSLSSGCSPSGYDDWLFTRLRGVGADDHVWIDDGMLDSSRKFACVPQPTRPVGRSHAAHPEGAGSANAGSSGSLGRPAKPTRHAGRITDAYP